MRAVAVRRLGVAVVLGAGLLVAGCGVSTQEQPVRIDRDEVPFGLLRDSADEPVTPTTAPAAPAALATEPVAPAP